MDNNNEFSQSCMLPKFASDAYETLQNEGVKRLFQRGVEFSLLRIPILNAVTRRAYWHLIPPIYRMMRTPEYSLPLDPFWVGWVDTDSITRVSGRPWPRYSSAPQDFGTVQGGSWDRTAEVDVKPWYDASPPEYYHASSFEETLIFRSLRQRFEEGRDWEAVDIVREAKKLLNDDSRFTWRGLESESEIDKRCAEIDELYEQIRDNGFKTQKQLIRNGKISGRTRLLELLGNEILIDVGRNGELLLSDGYHRLSIAKLLEIEQVPATIAVRHTNWIQRLQTAIDKECTLDSRHPDVRQLQDAGVL